MLQRPSPAYHFENYHDIVDYLSSFSWSVIQAGFIDALVTWLQFTNQISAVFWSVEWFLNDQMEFFTTPMSLMTGI